MSQVVIDIPDEALAALNQDPELAGNELRLAAAAKLYEMQRLSSGAAARLAGISRVAFLERLAAFGVSTFAFDADELNRETRLG